MCLAQQGLCTQCMSFWLWELGLTPSPSSAVCWKRCVRARHHPPSIDMPRAMLLHQLDYCSCKASTFTAIILLTSIRESYNNLRAEPRCLCRCLRARGPAQGRAPAPVGAPGRLRAAARAAPGVAPRPGVGGGPARQVDGAVGRAGELPWRAGPGIVGQSFLAPWASWPTPWPSCNY